MVNPESQGCVGTKNIDFPIISNEGGRFVFKQFIEGLSRHPEDTFQSDTTDVSCTLRDGVFANIEDPDFAQMIVSSVIDVFNGVAFKDLEPFAAHIGVGISLASGGFVRAAIFNLTDDGAGQDVFTAAFVLNFPSNLCGSISGYYRELSEPLNRVLSAKLTELLETETKIAVDVKFFLGAGSEQTKEDLTLGALNEMVFTRIPKPVACFSCPSRMLKEASFPTSNS